MYSENNFQEKGKDLSLVTPDDVVFAPHLDTSYLKIDLHKLQNLFKEHLKAERSKLDVA